jgi:hypothetical protein
MTMAKKDAEILAAQYLSALGRTQAQRNKLLNILEEYDETVQTQIAYLAKEYGTEPWFVNLCEQIESISVEAVSIIQLIEQLEFKEDI